MLSVFTLLSDKSINQKALLNDSCGPLLTSILANSIAKSGYIQRSID